MTDRPSNADKPEGIKNLRNYLGLPPTDPKDPQAEAFKQANEALNNAKVPTEDRQVMDADDPRVFNPLAAQTDMGEVISGILENFRVRTLEKQDKGNKRDAIKALLALFQAREQEILLKEADDSLRYLLQVLQEVYENTHLKLRDAEEAIWQTIERIRKDRAELQNKTNDGGRDGASE